MMITNKVLKCTCGFNSRFAYLSSAIHDGTCPLSTVKTFTYRGLDTMTDRQDEVRDNIYVQNVYNILSAEAVARGMESDILLHYMIDLYNLKHPKLVTIPVTITFYKQTGKYYTSCNVDIKIRVGYSQSDLIDAIITFQTAISPNWEVNTECNVTVVNDPANDSIFINKLVSAEDIRQYAKIHNQK